MSRLFAAYAALDSDAWYTPPWIFDGLGLTFDLDVAAPADACLDAEAYAHVLDLALSRFGACRLERPDD